MGKKAGIDIPHEEIAQFCKKWKIAEFFLFGSALREDFRSDSDVDVLVTFAPDARHGLFDMARMKRELAGIFGRDVDLLTRPSVEASPNYIRRKAILNSAVLIYAQRGVAATKSCLGTVPILSRGLRGISLRSTKESESLRGQSRFYGTSCP